MILILDLVIMKWGHPEIKWNGRPEWNGIHDRDQLEYAPWASQVRIYR